MTYARSLLSVLMLLSAAATGACTAGSGGEPTARSNEALRIVPPGPIGKIGTVAVAASDQSFLTPRSWSKDFASSTGWNPFVHVRVLADIDHDGKQDIVGFGDGRCMC